MGTVLVSVLVVVVATIAIWLGSEWLEEASAKLAVYYDLPPVVQGGIIAAAGSSFPELASVVFAALAGSFDLGVGAIIGSAIFNVLVIPALAVLIPGRPMDATRTLVHKEALFYLLAVVVFFFTLALALIYNPTVSGLTATANGSLTATPAGSSLSGELTRPLVVFPLLVYVLYLFLQWQDTADYAGRIETIRVDVVRSWGKLGAGLFVILVAVHQLVDAVLTLGETAGTPEFLWGVTIVAAATSLPDALVSVQAASKARDVASIANVLGSNTFDLLVVIPIGVLLTGAASVNFEIAAPMMGCLVIATTLLFVALRTDLVLSRRESYVLLGSYGLFVGWATLEAVGVIGFLGA